MPVIRSTCEGKSSWQFNVIPDVGTGLQFNNMLVDESWWVQFNDMPVIENALQFNDVLVIEMDKGSGYEGWEVKE